MGTIGVMAPGDLGGLNLSTVLRVFFVCGNMRNATDALTMRAAESATALLGIPETIRHILIEKAERNRAAYQMFWNLPSGRA